MNDATFRKLEFQAVRDLLAEYCGCALGKQLAQTLTPSTSPAQVKFWQEQVRELLLRIGDVGFPPMGGVHDVRGHVRAAAFPAPLEADQLADVAETLAATGPLRAWFERLGDNAPSLRTVGDRVADLTSIAAVISESIDERGQVRDYASPRLSNIRRSIENGRARIREVFDRILRHHQITKMLQYAGSTFHDDRMVLPLKAEYRGRVQGIIHRSSDSGVTLFVEPSESVELNNSIIRLKEEEKKEITLILRGLTQRVHLNAEPILGALRAMAVLDLVGAKCRYAMKRRCVCPIVDDNGVLDLHDARHPLLVELFARKTEEDGKPHEVVANDMRLGDDFDILVITGPNTGGKTVMLKTAGILALMNQCGVPIPAREGSRMPVYRQVFIDIGDEQSLQQSLSTFSSHLSNQLDILRRTGKDSLVLIDELGAGTDPDEGAAIGRSIIAELLQLGGKAIVTTHLSALKAVAYSTRRVDNGCVEFDPESLRPTFRLRIGEPGNSNALIIAKRLGMPARLVKQAKDYLTDTTRALNKAIAGTLESRREAEEARRAAREAELEAQRQREQYEKERDELARKENEFEQWTTWINGLRAGERVFLKSLRCDAKVVRVQLHKQVAVVSSRGMDLEVPLRDIAPPGPEEDDA